MKEWFRVLKTLVIAGTILSIAGCTKMPIRAELDLPLPPPPSYHGSSYKYLVNNQNFLTIKKFDGLGFPKNLAKEKLRQLLQEFSDEVYLVGFRHLGDPDDAQHGHILLSSDHQDGIIILYHTQEFSGSEYSFDKYKRSWIQWVSNGKIEDAYKYIRKTYPETPEWTAWKEKFLQANTATGSVDFEMLDPDLLRVDIRYKFDNTLIFVEIANKMQFTFTKIKCEKLPSRIPTDSNIVEVQWDSRKACLIINTDY